MADSADLPQKLDVQSFKQLELELRQKLLSAQLEMIEKKAFSTLIVVDGLDGAGKGESVARLYEWMDARHLVCNAYGEPTDEARARPRLWQFWRDLPAKGETAIVFGSWYQRILREHISGSMDDKTVEHELARVRRFEEMLALEGVLVLKFWYTLPRGEQKRRLEEIGKKKHAARHVLADWAALKNYNKATELGERIIHETGDTHAPWFVIPSKDAQVRDASVAKEIASAMRAKLDECKAAAPASRAPVTKQTTVSSALDAIDLTARLDEETYERKLAKLQRKLSDMSDQKAFSKTGMILVFQGNDAAGKGGAIRRVIQPLDPRIYKVYPIGAPTDEELARPYLWRFWRRMPRRGQIAIFDRSWYERVLVERVEGYARHEAWSRAYEEINEFERELTDFGFSICKFWLGISADEQLRRFKAREETAHKMHKITDDDWRNRLKWDKYAIAAADMVERTNTDHAPWTLVSSEDKRHARIEVLKTICRELKQKL